MKAFIISILAVVAWGIPVLCMAQINTGSNGSDGAFNPTSNITINMADRPTGIYQYTSVNIPAGVTVTFTPNANNTPVVWLVQGNCVISGTINLNGGSYNGSPSGGVGGPGGYSGGNAGSNPSPGQGPGGGPAGASSGFGSSASYGLLGIGGPGVIYPTPGPTYGNTFILPLLGGSGGGGMQYEDGGGGGGAILIADPNQIQINGSILARGGVGGVYDGSMAGGMGSGGAVRLVAQSISGSGTIDTNGGDGGLSHIGGLGRIRFDCNSSSFGGAINSVFTQGFQPIILPAAGQGIQMAIASVGGVPVATSPTGQLATPDVVISGQQTNPISIVVNCTNLPLNTPLTVTVTPTNGTPVTVQGANNTGTQASSTATVSVNMPHGGGIIYAQTVTAVLTASNTSLKNGRSYAETGLTTSGERFTKMEITASLGGKQRIVYLTESGKRYPFPVQ